LRLLIAPLCGGKDGVDDSPVARTPAEVAGHPFTNVGLRRIGVFREQRDCGNRLTRRTEPALKPAVPNERVLDGRNRPVACQALDVVIVRPWTLAARSRHADINCPSTRMLQAPQTPIPQLSLVPVMPRSSRNRSMTRRSPGMSRATGRPLIVAENRKAETVVTR
jgi:hypothetical protein